MKHYLILLSVLFGLSSQAFASYQCWSINHDKHGPENLKCLKLESLCLESGLVTLIEANGKLAERYDYVETYPEECFANESCLPGRIHYSSSSSDLHFLTTSTVWWNDVDYLDYSVGNLSCGYSIDGLIPRSLLE